MEQQRRPIIKFFEDTILERLESRLQTYIDLNHIKAANIRKIYFTSIEVTSKLHASQLYNKEISNKVMFVYVDNIIDDKEESNTMIQCIRCKKYINNNNGKQQHEGGYNTTNFLCNDCITDIDIKKQQQATYNSNISSSYGANKYRYADKFSEMVNELEDRLNKLNDIVENNQRILENERNNKTNNKDSDKDERYEQ